jgi:hypothetical protein
MFMKKLMFAAVIVGSLAGVSCKVGKGCPTNGKNVGAEKLLSGDAKGIKAAKKAKKFKA